MKTKSVNQWLVVVACVMLLAPGVSKAKELSSADAQAFLTRVETELRTLSIDAARAAWIQSNFITFDSQILAASANEKIITAAVQFAKEAAEFNDVEVDAATRRKLDILRRSLTMPAPSNPDKTAELTKIASDMEAMYGSGKYCPEGGECRDLQELSRVLRESRDPDELSEAWAGWRTISVPMRPMYERFAQLSNEGAAELGYRDTGAMWRENYDMPAEDFTKELDRLWGQVKPLYDSLHCYVRSRLNEKYGDTVQPLDRPIRADLLGNMWGQEWANISDIVGAGDADPGYNLTEILEAKKVDPQEMVKIGERFFTSLGFDPLPDTFWERSLFTKPQDREVVCHASAWSIDYEDDLRIKMCIEPTAEDFQTIHHELGHNFYQRAYNQQDLLFQDSANDGFHEAVGDAIALSVTPAYLVKIGFLDEEPPASKDLGLLLDKALDKIAFLPFGLVVDQWRWKVFSGEVRPADYNKAWWELRNRYQGLEPPVARSEADFDPGAKYHVPGNTPYTRYFLAAILQFQFHRAMCDLAGYEGPLNRCTIYGNEAVGERLKSMLAMGRTEPWPDELEALTGQRQIDASAIVDYFEPLLVWLNEQNEGQSCGW